MLVIPLISRLYAIKLINLGSITPLSDNQAICDRFTEHSREFRRFTDKTRGMQRNPNIQQYAKGSIYAKPK